MVDRLITSLRSLAASTDRPRDQSRCADAALDFSDALLLVSDCPQVVLTPVQRSALQELDEHLQWLTGGAGASAQNGAGRPLEDWTTVRRLARDALDALGHSATTPAATHSQDGRAR